jgi:prepilin-type N-terminal cleavage/methylation domain-containing protein
MRKIPRSGFSLIEVIVVLSLSGIVLGLGGIRYISYQRHQVLEKASQKFEANLKLAKQKAMSHNRPANCAGELSGYKIWIDTTEHEPVSYYVSAICDGVEVLESSYKLTEEDEVYFVNWNSSFITFDTLGGQCTPPNTTSRFTLLNKNDNTDYRCTISVSCGFGDIKFNGCESS